MKYLKVLLLIVITCTAFVLSNPNCPTGKTGAPSASTGSVSNCTSCHGGNSLNAAGGGIVVSGLPTTYTAGTAYSFSVKINHASANRTVWGFAIKAIDTVARVVVGTWSTSNANTSIKGTAGGTSYELSHAHAGTSASANTYTYSNLTWTAPAVPTANQARVKFYIAAVAGDGSGDETGDFVYTTTFTSNQQVAPPPPPACVFTYGTWSTCSNGIQTRAYSTSPSGCTGTPPTDSIQRTCTVVPILPTVQVITQTPVSGTCDTLKTFSVPIQSGVSYAWTITGTGNSIINGQNTNSITAVTKAAGVAYVTLSNTVGSIPTVSSTFARAVPPTPNTLLGSTTPCAGATFTYQTASAAPTATQVAVDHYSWTIPVGASITSGTPDSSTITIAYSSTFTTGTISVKSVSACNIISGSKSVAVAPAKPLDLVSSTGFWNACIGNSVTYYVVSALVNTGTIYRWTKPVGTQITNANADSSIITLSFITGFRGGALTVKSATSCGTLGTVLSKTLTHLNCAPGTRPGVEILTESQATVFPNPSDGVFTLKVQCKNNWTGNSVVRVMDVTGKTLYQYNVPMVDGLLSKTIYTTLSRGIYIVTYSAFNDISSFKIYIK